ncbi:MAG: AIPR family protein [Terriglobia bacterium]|jgi:cold shock CspA family protein
MELILKSHFNKFKKSFEIETGEKSENESRAFEQFVNYVLFSMDYPDVFTADADLLDFVSVGGADDIFIDGIGIKINDRLVQSIQEVAEITRASKKLDVEFVFIQAKMRHGFEMSELINLGAGVRMFFSAKALPENDKVAEFRQIKDYVYSDDQVISKLKNNPSLSIFYVTTGTEPADEHFSASRETIARDLSDLADCCFDHVDVRLVGGKQLIKYCRELENTFEVQINIKDIFPLFVDPKADIKKAYAFTCGAPEFLKVLQKEDGLLRRALFNDNVRDYLGNQGAINGEMETTIIGNPEMFLLCNNGITIVCTGFEQVRDKLVKIENPQIVNGCQTSSTIFALREHRNMAKIQLLVRVISTENHAVSNSIVRGTNRQNQVLEEAFEATLPFHQDTLEPYFAAVEAEEKIYYERRARQYNNDPLVKKTQIVNLRILTQTFVGMFLDAPHESHRHEAKLLEQYAGDNGTRRLFREDHSPAPYYACARAWYMFEKYFREGRIERRYTPYKVHLLLIFRYSVGEPPPRLTRSKALDSYCEKVLAMLKQPEFDRQAKAVLEVFDKAHRLWTQKGGSRFGIKDNKEFTDLLIQQTARHFAHQLRPAPREETREQSEGQILRIIYRNGVWFGFIKRRAEQENIYFDGRGYKGDPAELVVGRKVTFEVGRSEKALFARNVTLPGPGRAAAP